MATSKIADYKKGHGLCVAIFNVAFGQAKPNQLDIEGKFRVGADIDMVNFTKSISSLDMTYEYHGNKKGAEIVDIMKDIRRRVNKDQDLYNSLIVLISSHGKENTILGIDNEEVDFKECIVKPLHNARCEGLKGKPKLFIVTACRAT